MSFVQLLLCDMCVCLHAGRGAVYSYDAIGSFERSGYACQVSKASDRLRWGGGAKLCQGGPICCLVQCSVPGNGQDIHGEHEAFTKSRSEIFSSIGDGACDGRWSVYITVFDKCGYPVFWKSQVQAYIYTTYCMYTICCIRHTSLTNGCHMKAII